MGLRFNPVCSRLYRGRVFSRKALSSIRVRATSEPQPWQTALAGFTSLLSGPDRVGLVEKRAEIVLQARLIGRSTAFLCAV
jgi:hypothetical protein